MPQALSEKYFNPLKNLAITKNKNKKIILKTVRTFTDL